MNLDTVKKFLESSKQPVAGLLLAGGVWLAGRVDLAVAKVDGRLERIDARIAAVERALNLPVASK
jgi:hypothetical protein